jgi:hypothetical protein
MPPLACVDCGIPFRCDRNGVLVIFRDAGDGRPYKVYDADRWRCPACGTLVLSGYGKEPRVIDEGQPEFLATVAALMQEADMIGRPRPIHYIDL